MPSKRFIPMYSDLPPTREELLQMRLVQQQRAKGGFEDSADRSFFLDRPAATDIDFGDDQDSEHDLKVIRHLQSVQNNPDYASSWYRKITKLQMQTLLTAMLYGAGAGSMGGYAATGSSTGAKGGSALGAALGALVGLGRMKANKTIVQGAFQGMVPEAGKTSMLAQELARKYNTATNRAVPVGLGLAGLAALARYGMDSMTAEKGLKWAVF